MLQIWRAIAPESAEDQLKISWRSWQLNAYNSWKFAEMVKCWNVYETVKRKTRMLTQRSQSQRSERCSCFGVEQLQLCSEAHLDVFGLSVMWETFNLTGVLSRGFSVNSCGGAAGAAGRISNELCTNRRMKMIFWSPRSGTCGGLRAADHVQPTSGRTACSSWSYVTSGGRTVRVRAASTFASCSFGKITQEPGKTPNNSLLMQEGGK